MKVEQRIYKSQEGWSSQNINQEVQLVLAFCSPILVKKESSYNSLKTFYPNAEIVLVSTAGEIMDIELHDDSISVNALTFEKTKIKVVSKEVKDIKNSFGVAEKLANEINLENLKYILMFQCGLGINGEYFLDGVKSILNKSIGIIGGLAGNIINPYETYVSLNGIPTEENLSIIVGLYGDSIQIGSASFAGFDTFGIERKITKSCENIVYELDGKPILDLYTKYLGEQANKLPGSGVYFPISIYKKDIKYGIIRSLLTIDKKSGSITFSGNVKEGYNASLMNTNFSKLVKASGEAAKFSLKHNPKPNFALLISCVGRRIILKQRTEEEIEIVREIIGEKPKIGGFYSYGEIGINGNTFDCEFHNETMTIALFSEK